MNFVKSLRIPFLQNTSGRQLLIQFWATAFKSIFVKTKVNCWRQEASAFVEYAFLEERKPDNE